CSTMPMWLLLLLCLSGNVFAKEPLDVDCLVMHLQYVHCHWNRQGTPEVNYIFYGWFKRMECPMYLTENNIRIGCKQPMSNRSNRFRTFKTELVHGNNTFLKDHQLKSKGKLYPPTNVRVKMESDSNLWCYWNQTAPKCVESKIRYRTNNRDWENFSRSVGMQSYCINLPSKNSLYELQVQSKLGDMCGGSMWSEWSESVFWGSNNSTGRTANWGEKKQGFHFEIPDFSWKLRETTAVELWMTMVASNIARVLCFDEEIIPLGVISVCIHNQGDPLMHFFFFLIKDWLQISKGLKESFNPNYNERACPVREYCPVSQADCESLSSSSTVVATCEEAEQTPV
uniref:Fibronectin type-III domain-containing protein n=1 Tax=Mola mola TaxID=94237 RepID=A0A3Q3X201_MOLML